MGWEGWERIGTGIVKGLRWDGKIKQWDGTDRNRDCERIEMGFEGKAMGWNR